MNDAHRLKAPIIFTAISAVVFLFLGIFGIIFLKNNEGGFLTPKSTGNEFAKFSSDEEFQEYLQNSTARSSVGRGLFSSSFGSPDSQESLELSAPSSNTNPAPRRYSETNVQVGGIDEPDIVKTDGNNIYVSTESFAIWGRGVTPLIAEDLPLPIDREILPAPEYTQPTTKVVSALPPENISLDGEIQTVGDLLLEGDNLLVIAHDRITGFDVSNPQSPVQKWQHVLNENHQYNTARLINGKVYLVTNRYADLGMPCPMPIFDNALTILCTDIYRIGRPIDANSVYSIVKLNPENGAVEDSTSFVGSSGQSVIYMSENAIYATFTSYPNPSDFMSNFFSQNSDLVGQEATARIANLNNIDISNESKLNELHIILIKHLNTLSKDERERIQSEIANRMTNYLKEHGRELQRTSIVKINKDNLGVSSMGEVAGAPLNQFSLDEYQNNLRIVTTVNASTTFGTGESANDLYVLDDKLETIGEIQDLALGERVYSARFINDKAYVVTFKQIDPFFVIDLSAPNNPQVAGELKLPGFSSYLHPLSENLILGVGQEESRSKISIFDVTNANNPQEVQKYTLDEFWSEVQNNHHAFLHDQDNQIFFMPAGQSGYIFSYSDGLQLVRAVSDISARRAVYINDYLYVVGDQKIIVLNENDWQQVGSLEF